MSIVCIFALCMCAVDSSLCLVQVFSGVVTERAAASPLDKEAHTPAQVGGAVHGARMRM